MQAQYPHLVGTSLKQHCVKSILNNVRKQIRNQTGYTKTGYNSHHFLLM